LTPAAGPNRTKLVPRVVGEPIEDSAAGPAPPPITFHALRHTAATLRLGQGEHPKVAQELLGHAQVSITLDRYSHMTPTLMSGAAATMDRLLDG
jgi:integrase